MKKRIKRTKNDGFTLVELMITLCISSFIMIAVYMTYNSQHKSYDCQDQILAMQQNIRAGLYIMQREIRMAGYDPTKTAITTTNAALYTPGGNYTPGAASISFRMDVTDNPTTGDPDGDTGDADEEITYNLLDGDADGNMDDLCRTTGGVMQMLAENIEAIGFAYAYDADGNGRIDTYTDGGGQDRIIWALDTNADGDWDNLDTDNDGLIDNDDSPTPGDLTVTENILGTNTGTAVDENDIRAVRIWMLAISDRENNDYFDNNTYIVGNQKIPGLDSLRRRLLSVIVEFRNIGL